MFEVCNKKLNSLVTMLIYGLIGIVASVSRKSVANKQSVIEHLSQKRQCL
jgi:hypothetical protein